MNQELNPCDKKQTKVELQVSPCVKSIAHDKQNVSVMNHESQDDNCNGKIILTVTCDGAKLTKADAGRLEEYQEEVWVTAKVTNTDKGKLPDVDVSVRERCGSKLTKADSGLA
jgi:hypothetical protein